MKEKIQKLIKTGFFSIYISEILAKVITMFGGVLLVRLMTKDDYGIYTLVQNALSMLCIFGDFGAADATLQFALENEENQDKQNGIFLLGIKMLLFSTFLSSVIIIISPLFYPYKTDYIEKLTIFMCLIPFFNAMINYISIVLRSKKENNKFSFYQIIITIIHYTVILVFTKIYGLKGALFSQYVYNILLIIIGILILKKMLNLKHFEEIKQQEKKDFFKLAIGTQFNHTLNNMLYQIDIFTLSIMIASPADISIYKVATVIPTAFAFLPLCLMTYLLPNFIEHNKEKGWIRNKTKKLILYSFPFYLIITIVFIGLSKNIFLILYGKQYVDAYLPFSLLMIGFLFSATIKSPIYSIAYVLHNIKFNVCVSIISLIANFILNIIFIKIFGIIGVAISTLIINILGSIASIIYIYNVTKEVKNK